MDAQERSPFADSLARMGEQIRAARRSQKVTAEVLASMAGISRPTLHRIEKGDLGVAIGSFMAAAKALGLELGFQGTTGEHAPPVVADTIRLDDYPELQQLAWQLGGLKDLSPRQALELYERNWRHLDRGKLTLKEVELIDNLTRTLGGGRLLV